MCDNMTPESSYSPARPHIGRWFARLGVWGMLFFLLKGLAWLVVPALLAKGLSD